MTDRLVLSLKRAKDDPDQFGDRYQNELRTYSKQMQFTAQRAFTIDAVGAGGGPLGEFIFTNATALITAITAVAGAWIAAHKGRKVRLKIGDIEAEAASTEEVQQLLELAKTYETAQVEKPKK